MESKILSVAAAAVAIIVILGFVVASGRGSTDPQDPTTYHWEYMTGQPYDAEGWLSSPDAANPGELEHEEVIPTSGNVTKITFTCSIADSNVENAETDDNSDPDTVEFLISDGGNNTATIQIMTDGTQNLVSQSMEFLCEDVEGSFMGHNWTVRINPTEFQGGKPVYHPRIPWVYIDQGVEWRIHVEYEYAMLVPDI